MFGLTKGKGMISRKEKKRNGNLNPLTSCIVWVTFKVFTSPISPTSAPPPTSSLLCCHHYPFPVAATTSYPVVPPTSLHFRCHTFLFLMSLCLTTAIKGEVEMLNVKLTYRVLVEQLNHLKPPLMIKEVFSFSLLSYFWIFLTCW